MHVSKKAGHFDKLCDRPLVEISGLEPELAEPKSVVLPLHHTSVQYCKVIIFLNILQVISSVRLAQDNKRSYERSIHFSGRRL